MEVDNLKSVTPQKIQETFNIRKGKGSVTERSSKDGTLSEGN